MKQAAGGGGSLKSPQRTLAKTETQKLVQFFETINVLLIESPKNFNNLKTNMARLVLG